VAPYSGLPWRDENGLAWRIARNTQLGYPIATGVIEGACRYLIKDRLDITGARWSLSGAEAILKLRSLRASGDFEDYWAFHEKKELERNHVKKYLDGKIPSGKLRLLKK
jgi:hypothetical protein